MRIKTANSAQLGAVAPLLLVGLLIISIFLVTRLVDVQQIFRSKASDSPIPTNLLSEWQNSGVVLSTQSPILTWQNPTGDIEAVVVKVRSKEDMSGCDNESLVDFWFYKSGQSQIQTCPNSLTREFRDGSPTSFIIPPGVLKNEGRVYWSVWIKKNGQFYSSTGYIQGIGGNQLSRTFFDYQQHRTPLAANKFGVTVSQYYSEKGFSDDQKWIDHLDWTKNLVGAGGYIKLFFPWVGDWDVPIDNYKKVLTEVYKRDLVPIVRVDGDWVTRSDGTGCWRRPDQDDERNYNLKGGSYKNAAAKMVSFINQLPLPPDNKPLYIEVWNEMNYGAIEWCDARGNFIEGGEPENYARYYAEVFKQLKDTRKDQIKVMTGGLGRLGYDRFMQSMVVELQKISSESRFSSGFTVQEYLENFATHVYPLLNKEDMQISDSRGNFHQSPFQYKHQVDILHNLGLDVSKIEFFITEGGYYDGVRLDIKDQARLTKDLINWWATDDRIVSVSFFTLDDYTDPTVFPGVRSPLDLNTWVPNGSPTSNGLPIGSRPVYEAAKDQIKRYLR